MIKRYYMLLVLVLGMTAQDELLSSPSSHEAEQRNFEEAQRSGADACFYLHVIADDGTPVEGADVLVGFWLPWVHDAGRHVATDHGGNCVIQGRAVDDCHVNIRKTGCYETDQTFTFPRRDDPSCVKDGRWQPYGATNTLVLKRIRHPVPMLAKSSFFDHLRFPATNTVVGFDLKLWDWCPPYGKGLYDDLQLKFEIVEPDTNNPFASSSRMTLTLTNCLDGVYLVPKDTFSAFKSAYTADTNAVYQKRFVCDCVPKKSWRAKDPGLDEDHYLVFRTRTKTDEAGHLTAANYGKIYGPLRFARNIELMSYFNPTVNDTNLEYDPKGDLFYDGNWRHRTNYAP